MSDRELATSMTYYEPLGVGEILDAGMSLWRRHFKTLFMIGLFLTGPVLLLNAIFLITQRPTIDNFGRFIVDDAEAFLGVQSLVALAGFVLGFVALNAQIYAAVTAYRGGTPGIVESIKQGIRRILPFVALMVVLGLMFYVGSIALVIPGFFLLVSFSLSIPAFWGDPTGAISALGRGWRLAKGRRWAILGLLVSLFFFIYIFAILAFLSLLIVPFFTGSFVTLVMFGLGGPIILLVLSPIYPVVITAAYFDARIRNEGLDVELTIEDILTKTQPWTTQPGV